MDRDTVWRHIHTERRALAEHLRGLDAEQWAHDSLCAGWTVRDVAAHLISGPQIRVRDLPRIFTTNGFGYNQMIYNDVKKRGRQPIEQILADYDRLDGSRDKPPTTTIIEPLLDALVHVQDILRPLGIEHRVDPAAAAVAADRARLLSALMGSRKLVRSVRMVATDTDWDRGKGPVLEGPMQELMMLCAGRQADPALVSGVPVEQ